MTISTIFIGNVNLSLKKNEKKKFYSLFEILHEKLNQCNCSKESKAERLKIIGNKYIFQS